MPVPAAREMRAKPAAPRQALGDLLGVQLWVLVLTADGPERPCRCIGPFSTEEAALAHGAGLDLPGGGYQVAPLTPVGTVMLR